MIRERWTITTVKGVRSPRRQRNCLYLALQLQKCGRKKLIEIKEKQTHS